LILAGASLGVFKVQAVRECEMHNNVLPRRDAVVHRAQSQFSTRQRTASPFAQLVARRFDRNPRLDETIQGKDPQFANLAA